MYIDSKHFKAVEWYNKIWFWLILTRLQDTRPRWGRWLSGWMTTGQLTRRDTLSKLVLYPNGRVIQISLPSTPKGPLDMLDIRSETWPGLATWICSIWCHMSLPSITWGLARRCKLSWGLLRSCRRLGDKPQVVPGMHRVLLAQEIPETNTIGTTKQRWSSRAANFSSPSSPSFCWPVHGQFQEHCWDISKSHLSLRRSFLRFSKHLMASAISFLFGM